MAIEIEKGVPLPNGRTNHAYPWSDMEIGDCVRPRGRSQSAALNLAKAASHRLAPKQFKAGKAADGNYRVWRTA